MPREGRAAQGVPGASQWPAAAGRQCQGRGVVLACSTLEPVVARPGDRPGRGVAVSELFERVAIDIAYVVLDPRIRY